MRKLLPVLALLFVSPAFAVIGTTSLVRLFTVTNASYGDNFYSVNESQVDLAMSCCGYYSKAIVGFMEPTPDSDGTTAWFRRTYGGPPYIDHFYTTRMSDWSFVISIGYIDEGAEGVLRSYPITAGSVPLYRLSHYNPSNGDVMHWYGVDFAQRNAYIQWAGWYDEGVEGYMWPNPGPNVDIQGGNSTIAGGYCSSAGYASCYVRVPGISEYGAPASIGYCGGTLDVYIDGVHTQTYSSFSYSGLPGYESPYYDCHAPWSPAAGTHTYRFEFSGYRYRSTYTGQYGIKAPYVSQQTATF
jgi:hypothetical protein